MPKDYAALAPNEVRRSDRAVDDEAWIRAMLHRAPVGALATINEGQPFINTNLFVYDEAEHVIYTHTARFGRTRSNVEAENRACFSISEMGRLLPAPEALEFSVEYSGVAVFGPVEIVEDAAESTRALQLILDKYAPHLKPGTDYRPPVEEELKRTAVYKLHIESWSGKRKVADPDFPGAYLFHDVVTLYTDQYS